MGFRSEVHYRIGIGFGKHLHERVQIADVGPVETIIRVVCD
jgi:hypothetical protein